MEKTCLYTAQCNTHSAHVKQGLFHTYKMRNSTGKWSKSKDDSKDTVNTQVHIETQQTGTGFLGKNISYMFKMPKENKLLHQYVALVRFSMMYLPSSTSHSKREKLMNIDHACKPYLKKKNNGFVP